MDSHSRSELPFARGASDKPALTPEDMHPRVKASPGQGEGADGIGRDRTQLRPSDLAW